MNTYWINTTRGKEFEVERELLALGLRPWVPLRLCSKRTKGGTKWYNKPYASKIIFAIIPAASWLDVKRIKHVIGNPAVVPGRQVTGIGWDRNGNQITRPNSLAAFKAAVDAEYAERERLRENNEYVCTYETGQALELLDGLFEDVPAKFIKAVKDAKGDAKLRVEVEAMGQVMKMDIAPATVRAAV